MGSSGPRPDDLNANEALAREYKPHSVLTIGSFDGLHAGHVRFLNNAAQFGIELIVGVNTDDFVYSYKGHKPLFSLVDRMHVLEQLNCVTLVVPNDGPGHMLIKKVKPYVLAIGPDWLPPRDYLGQIGMTADELMSLDTTLAFVPPPRVEGLSSSSLRANAS